MDWESAVHASLLETQRKVAAALRTGEAALALDLFEGDAGPRLAVHRQTIEGALVRALRLNAPAVERLVGPEFFEGAARIFLADRPAGKPRLDEYGGGFAHFLAGFAPARELAYLADVARLERAVARALHAPEPAPLDIAALQDAALASAGRLALLPHPALSLLRLQWPADAIWRAVLEGDEGALRALRLDGPQPRAVLVHRERGALQVEPVPAPQAAFLETLLDGALLCEAMAGDAQLDTVSLLGSHLQAGRFTGFIPRTQENPS